MSFVPYACTALRVHDSVHVSVTQAVAGAQGGLPALASRVAALREERAALSGEVARLAASNAKYEQVGVAYWQAD